MPFRGQTYKIHNIPSARFGLNTQQESDEISDFELADCENIYVEDDSIKSATGYVQWDDNEPSGSPADYTNYGPYWGGTTFKKSDGTVVAVRQRQDILEYSIGSDSAGWTACTLSTSGSPASAVSLDQKQPTFATLNDTLVFCNGQLVMYTEDGITWYNDTDLIYGGGVPDIVFNNGLNRLLYVFKDESLIWWSDINQPLVVGVTSYQYIDPNAGQAIIGMGMTPSGTLLCFKEDGLYELDDITSGMIGVNFIGKCNPTNHHTICTTDNSVMFSDYASLVCEYIGGIIRPIAGRIRVSDPRWSHSLRYDLYCATFYNYKYRLSLPDGNVSEDYNGQEFVFFKKLFRDDPIQPYVITRNKRFFGCYWLENVVWDYGRDITCYVGDSRSDGNVFAFVNDFRAVEYNDGLNGEEQECYFITKFFTDDIPYYVKRFKKIFSNLKVEQDLEITIGYRFLPYGAFTEESLNFTAGELEMDYGNGESGVFSEGFGFSAETLGNVFMDVENADKPRGIQFKVSWSEISDVTVMGMAYQFKVKPKFH